MLAASRLWSSRVFLGFHCVGGFGAVIICAMVWPLATFSWYVTVLGQTVASLRDEVSG
jgi:hypothetical protein